MTHVDNTQCICDCMQTMAGRIPSHGKEGQRSIIVMTQEQKEYFEALIVLQLQIACCCCAIQQLNGEGGSSTKQGLSVYNCSNLICEEQGCHMPTVKQIVAKHNCKC